MSWNISWEVKKEKDRDRPFVVCRWMINREEEDFRLHLLRRRKEKERKERERQKRKLKERKREEKKERRKTEGKKEK